MLVRSSGVLYSDVMKFCANISNKIVLFSAGLVIVVLLTGSRVVAGDEDETSSSSSSLSSTTSSSSSEEKSAGVPIIRQINKVNDDGTYTYGYEAADGSFKIETRDVLGNVKGMFGFIDESGDLKRVSYTANNETGFKNSVLHPPTSTPYSTARPTLHTTGSGSRSATEPVRRPVLILKNIPLTHHHRAASTTKGPVIQHIPKKSKDNEDEDEDEQVVGINGRRFPISGGGGGGGGSANESSTTSGEERTGNGNGDQGKSSQGSASASAGNNNNPLRKVLVSKRPVIDDTNLNKDIVKSAGKGGNSLRRQLSRGGGLDLRGEMSHIYGGGGDGRYPSNLPAHLDALMSELRPIQVVRTGLSPESIGYQTVDIEALSPQPEINPHHHHHQHHHEVSTTTTTELPSPQPPPPLPYGTRKYIHAASGPAAGYISRYRPGGGAGVRPGHHVVAVPVSPGTSSAEETQQYLQEVSPRQAIPQHLPAVPQTLPYALNVPFGGQAAPNYQAHPHYYDQGSAGPYSGIPPTLRDELMAIIFNYLQVRLGPGGGAGPIGGGYYPNPAAYPRSPIPPISPYANPYPYNSPLVNPNPYSANPYVSPFLPLPQHPYYPYANPAAALGLPYPIAAGGQGPYATGPNVQFSPRQEVPTAAAYRRVAPSLSSNRLPTRATTAGNSADDADLLQMLLTSPTRMPISQLKYAPTSATERSLSSRVTQPIRNIQIITETTESRPVTTETPER